MYIVYVGLIIFYHKRESIGLIIYSLILNGFKNIIYNAVITIWWDFGIVLLAVMAL